MSDPIYPVYPAYPARRSVPAGPAGPAGPALFGTTYGLDYVPAPDVASTLPAMVPPVPADVAQGALAAFRSLSPSSAPAASPAEATPPTPSPSPSPAVPGVGAPVSADDLLRRLGNKPAFDPSRYFTGDYSQTPLPAAPTTVELGGPMPTRNRGAEGRAALKTGLLTGLLGLLVAGGRGALAGFSGGGEGSLRGADEKYATDVQNWQTHAADVMRDWQGNRDQIAAQNALAAARFGQAAKQAELGQELYKTDLTGYNQTLGDIAKLKGYESLTGYRNGKVADLVTKRLQAMTPQDRAAAFQDPGFVEGVERLGVLIPRLPSGEPDPNAFNVAPKPLDPSVVNKNNSQTDRNQSVTDLNRAKQPYVAGVQQSVIDRNRGAANASNAVAGLNDVKTQYQGPLMQSQTDKNNAAVDLDKARTDFVTVQTNQKQAGAKIDSPDKMFNFFGAETRRALAYRQAAEKQYLIGNNAAGDEFKQMEQAALGNRNYFASLHGYAVNNMGRLVKVSPDGTVPDLDAATGQPRSNQDRLTNSGAVVQPAPVDLSKARPVRPGTLPPIRVAPPGAGGAGGAGKGSDYQNWLNRTPKGVPTGR